MGGQMSFVLWCTQVLELALVLKGM